MNDRLKLILKFHGTLIECEDCKHGGCWQCERIPIKLKCPDNPDRLTCKECGMKLKEAGVDILWARDCGFANNLWVCEYFIKGEK